MPAYRQRAARLAQFLIAAIAFAGASAPQAIAQAAAAAPQTSPTAAAVPSASPSAASPEASSDPYELLKSLRSDDPKTRESVIMKIAQTGDLAMDDLLEAFHGGNLYIYEDRIVLGGDSFTDDNLNKFIPIIDIHTRKQVLGADGKPVNLPTSGLTPLSATRKERLLIANKALIILRLSSKDPEVRLAGAKRAGESDDLIEALPLLDGLRDHDPDPRVRYTAKESGYMLRISNPDQLPEGKTVAEMVLGLGEMKSLQGLPKLLSTEAAILKAGKETTRDQNQTLAACRVAIEKIKSHQRFVGFFENVFQGVSLGSILIFMALGLSITFGLMGVINMAHGELMMIGAYATYVMQLAITHLIDKGIIPKSAYDWYYIAALPASFAAAAFVGYIMERLVIRHLYRRPIESLLATWGIGLILIQAVRIWFGDNIGVNAPSWARGGVEIMQDVTLPFGRSFVMALCILSIVGIYLLMNKTRMGLLMRATMQNRDMANALGVSASKIDSFTFALGSGIAGLAGYAWTLIGGVTPDMGQKNFIVDSFLIVVTGGVGQLAGVIWSGLGIGVITKVIEPLEVGDTPLGAIWAKVCVLLMIIAFIQFRPAGLFAPKGRHADV